ncbi:heme lyase CcmF/NrfE family subunit [Candidatus Pelagibacter bacterium]|nr:heme lyase CcmF/NrfE family subunit [Candidatus Pelagibacter bacterium]
MLSNLGNFILFISVFICLSIIYTSFVNLKDEKAVLEKKIYQLCLIQCTLIILTFFTLVSAFIISDFSLITVYQNSHTLKPLLYKISGTWGNHEGSLLLWLIILTIFSFLFLVYNSSHPKNYRLYTLITQNLLILGFSFFLIFNSNPFSLLSPSPKEGLGLNPILQDPALAIHPPLLYVGFVGSSIYFSAAISSMLSNYSGKPFARSIKNWVLISWSFQTVGILAGSIWAYYELGWGGFWFWDPVENASLLPWFAMTALFHSLLVLEKRELFYFWVIILCIITFVLSVTGTFLVRSGILNSVHTFANDPSRGLYILVFLSFLIFSSIFILFRKFQISNYKINSKSKETFVLVNNWFMVFYLISVLIGTVYPIFTEVLTNHKVSVGPPFYNTVIIPLVVLFLIFMSMGPNIKWIKDNNINLNLLLRILFASILINYLIIYFFKSYSLLSNFIIISSIFLIISTFLDLYKSMNKRSFNLSRLTSHLAFGFMVFFIGLNHNFSFEKDFNLKLGEKKKFEDYTIEFENINLEEFKNYKSVIGKFNINNNSKDLNLVLSPEIRIYENPSTLTYEASIRSGLTKDYYITMSNLDRSDFYNIKFQKKPFMIWIWISVIFISLGGLMRLFKNENKNY